VKNKIIQNQSFELKIHAPSKSNRTQKKILMTTFEKQKQKKPLA